LPATGGARKRGALHRPPPRVLAFLPGAGTFIETKSVMDSATRSSVVAARVVHLLIGVGAATAGVAIAVRDRGQVQAPLRYLCPMHPDVRSATRGQCPICHMALEPMNRDAAIRPGTAAMPDITAVDNVRKHRIMDFVKKRALLPTVQELRGAAWVEKDGAISAIFYDDQIAAMEKGDAATFTLTQATEGALALRRTGEPPSRWDDSTSRIRFRLSPSAARTAILKEGDAGWVELARKPREVLTVPATAVLNGPDGPYVLAATASGFEKKQVQIGETFVKQGFAVVIAGLSLHDRVVARAAFFLDADRRLGLEGEEEGLVQE